MKTLIAVLVFVWHMVGFALGAASVGAACIVGDREPGFALVLLFIGVLVLYQTIYYFLEVYDRAKSRA